MCFHLPCSTSVNIIAVVGFSGTSLVVFLVGPQSDRIKLS